MASTAQLASFQLTFFGVDRLCDFTLTGFGPGLLPPRPCQSYVLSLLREHDVNLASGHTGAFARAHSQRCAIARADGARHGRASSVRRPDGLSNWQKARAVRFEHCSDIKNSFVLRVMSSRHHPFLFALEIESGILGDCSLIMFIGKRSLALGLANDFAISSAGEPYLAHIYSCIWQHC